MNFDTIKPLKKTIYKKSCISLNDEILKLYQTYI